MLITHGIGTRTLGLAISSLLSNTAAIEAKELEDLQGATIGHNSARCMCAWRRDS